MSFFVTQKTLERLEWHRILAMLGEHARTPGARARCVGEPSEAQPDPTSLFEASRHGVAERLSEKLLSWRTRKRLPPSAATDFGWPFLAENEG